MKKVSNKYLIIITILICLFLELCIHVYGSHVFNIDNSIYNFISKYFIRNNITSLMKLITYFGNQLLFVITIVILIMSKNKKISYSIIINLICSFSVNQVVKFIIRRNRPNINRIVSASGFSFPSGHSMVSFAYYGYLIYLVNKYVKDKNKRITYTILLSLLIFFIGFSRIYLGVHYFTDVIGGYLFALIYLLIYVNIINGYLDK